MSRMELKISYIDGEQRTIDLPIIEKENLTDKENFNIVKRCLIKAMSTNEAISIPLNNKSSRYFILNCSNVKDIDIRLILVGDKIE